MDSPEKNRGTNGITVNIIGNGHYNLSSNPGWGHFHFS